ncbi:MAG: hypothetical protein QG621_226 [Patescibacteria group bacterium]|nr:hypothetical protein [Patescibacteria group bacterium]
MTWHQYIHRIHSSRLATYAGVSLLCLLAGTLLFHAGAVWGERSAMERMRRGPGGPPPLFGFLPHSFMPEGHGAIGVISSTSLPILIMRSRENDDIEVLVSSSTVVVGGAARSPADLTLDQTVVIVGSPDTSGILQARFIRVLPPR